MTQHASNVFENYNQKTRLLTIELMDFLQTSGLGETKIFAKNAYLITQNELNKNIFFVKSGCLRSFVYDEDQNEVTIWLTFENQAVYSSASYILDLPSFVMIQALEDTEVIVLSKDILTKLFEANPEANDMQRRIMENYLVRLSYRSIGLQAQFAETRYLNLISQYPDIINRVPLRHIASFIGVKLETLSRIRGNYKNK
jgi:CRP/FNR family transcriptional regulator, anaerobic regulatory protein